MKTKLSHFAIPYVVWMDIFVVAPIIIMVVVTTIVTPILLKLVFKKNADAPVEAGKQVTSYYENADQYRGETRQKK